MEYPTHRFIPVLPIRNTVIFPGIALPLRVGRAKSIAAVQKASESAKAGDWIVAVTQKVEIEAREPTSSDLYSVGTLCKIEKVRGSAEDGFQVLVRGVARFKIEEFVEREDKADGDSVPKICIEALGDVWNDYQDADPKTIEALTDSLKVTAREILRLLPADTSQLEEMLDAIKDPILLTHLCAGNIEMSVARRQEILGTVSLKSRALTLLEMMQAQKDGLQVQTEIREKLGHKMGKVQREAILREQLRTIREELGEGEESRGAKDKEDYRKKIEDAKMPEEVLKTALEELKRFESIGNQSPESHVVRNYLDLLCAMPWSKSAETTEIDIEKARETLRKDHYGLEKIKKRILQHLAVMKLKKEGRGSILLLVGPPGVGKTSLGQSIAKALGRKFVRGSLGGVRDDAEIRGHRRTYIGALPGRIIQGLKRAGENNPVFMLDEIDKMSRSYNGDPASALLEVLDPEQNSTFLDHYLDVPFDLSKVFFIATANSLESIPGPLLDRMEVVDVSGYTSAEKLHIAKNHLAPKQLSEHGISEGGLEISDEAMLRVITHYTREAGVRELQRAIAAICRGSTEKLLAGTPVTVEIAQLDDLLGPERFVHEVAERIVPPGVVTGLAWTPQGGEILFIEASLMPGNGKLTLTGQLGDVMKESAQIALSLVRSKLSLVAPNFDYEKKDVHIHVPAGAIPKDGPSAGIAILTTIASLFSNRSVSPKTAMTGEITLRGAVMPVGGIKEKILAAHRAGIERVILSKRNEKDLRDVPEEVKSALKFEFVENANEVLKLALGLVSAGPADDEIDPHAGKGNGSQPGQQLGV
jgi:ATP-dependent Lon protease